jgi:hypothetical protein
VTNYTIKSDGHSGHHLLQWALSGSVDGHTWITLDQRNTQDLNANYVVKSYACESVQSPAPFFRFIRLTQYGVDSSGWQHLLLSKLELFGFVAE